MYIVLCCGALDNLLTTVKRGGKKKKVVLTQDTVLFVAYTITCSLISMLENIDPCNVSKSKKL